MKIIVEIGTGYVHQYGGVYSKTAHGVEDEHGNSWDGPLKIVETTTPIPDDFAPAHYKYAAGVFTRRTDLEPEWDGSTTDETRIVIRRRLQDEAKRRILLAVPEDKQRNFIMDWLELQEKRATGGTLTAKEKKFIQRSRLKRSGIKVIRDASNAIELLVPDMEEDALEVDYENHSEWPS